MSAVKRKADVMNFGRQLASSEKETRDKALKRVRKWLTSAPSAISENEMVKLWMGLYMTMWMADKPLIQEEVASNLASLVQCFSDSEQVFLFINSFFKTIRREWSNLDRLRMDKFYMLIRTMLRQTFEYLQQHGWRKLVNHYLELMKQALNVSSTFMLGDGITFHLVDVFLTELKKVSTDPLSDDVIVKLVKPFCHYLAVTPDASLREAITDNVFEPLAVALETSSKQKFPFTPATMSNEFLELAKDPNGVRSSVNRKCLYQLRQRFASLPVVEADSVHDMEQDVVDGGKLSKHKKRKGSRRQSVGEEYSEKRLKHSHVNGELSHEETSLESYEITTPNSLPTDINDTLLLDKDVSESITKDITVTSLSKAKVKRRRSLPATSTPRQTEEDEDVPKKKRRSLVEQHQDSLLVYSKPKTKEKKLKLSTGTPDDFLLLEETEPNPLNNSNVEVPVREKIPKQVVKTSPLCTRSGKQVRRLSDLSPQPVKKKSLKKVKLALQKNKSYAYQETVNTTFDSSKQPSRSVLKASKPQSHLTRRKSSRFSKHS